MKRSWRPGPRTGTRSARLPEGLPPGLQELAEGGGEFARRPVTGGRVLRHRLETNGLELGRGRWIDLPGRSRCILEDAPGEIGQRKRPTGRGPERLGSAVRADQMTHAPGPPLEQLPTAERRRDAGKALT